MIWSDAQLATLRTAVADARAGRPTLLVIEGESGTGKTALLDELLDLGDDFQVLYADGLETGERAPFDLLHQWGADPSEFADDRVSPMVAAQALRSRIDEMALTGAVLLRLDDLQWADPESVEAVTWLLRRATGDRLLVAVATRPLARDQHPLWQRWAAGRGHSVGIALSGLTAEDARELVRQRRPELGPGVAERLWRHTAGNPLYLTALLEERDSEELTRTRILPAPAEYAARTTAKVDRLREDATVLLQAVCVLGSGWLSLYDVAAIAEVEAPADGLQELVDSDLIKTRQWDTGMSIRVAHSLTRSAVYQSTPPALRQTLHLRVAAAATERSTALEHRIAAAQHYDDRLADDLDDYARDLHAHRSHRLAAQYRTSAAALTRLPAAREHRLLEAIFDHLLGQDIDRARTALDALAPVTDTALYAVVSGTQRIVLGEWDVAAAELESAPPKPLSPAAGSAGSADPATEYRRQVLLAWARIGSGAPTSAVEQNIRLATMLEPKDPALAGHLASTMAYVTERTTGVDGALRFVAALPDRPEAVPRKDTFTLAIRGVLRLRLGLLDQAAADLEELQRRFRDGAVDIADGGYLSRLGQLHWWRGEWDRARADFQLARDASGRFGHPIVSAMVSILPSSQGDFATADRWLDRARTFLTVKPWEEAGRALLTAEVIRLHAGGSAEERRQYVGSRPGTFRTLERSPANGILELVHAGLAYLWAGDTGRAGWAIDRIGDLPQGPSWRDMVVDWLRGLLAEAAGDRSVAVARLRRAAAAPGTEIPLYRAHIHADHARVAAAAGQRDAAAASARRADELYRGLGATPYLRPEQPGSRPGPPAADAWQLTDREREVLVLLVSGLSYAQIARELFITQSTVAYHLSHIYAKTGVTSRHQLTALVRAQPESFGMLAVGA